MNKLDANRLRQLLDYDPETGIFIWLASTSDRIKIGDRAGCFGIYWRIRVDGEAYLAHRLAWLYMTGEWPKQQVDHINCDKIDNRWANLREASPAQNNANCGKRPNNTSGFKGVTWHKRNARWQAQLSVGGKHLYLGQFDDPKDAASAYAVAALRHSGEFARL